MAEKPGLHPDREAGATLATTAHEVIREARDAVDDATRAESVAVHDVRKALKRWRALLRLFEPIVEADAGRMRAIARDLARELAGARDAQAALDAVADLEKAGSDLSPRTIATIRGRLDTLRASAESVTLTDAMREKLRAALEAAARAVDHWPLPGARFGDVADGLAVGFGRVRRAIPADWSVASDEELHDLRKRVVEHRYQMPLVEPLWPRFGKMWVGEAQRLRERLGSIQDLAVLAALTAPHAPLAPWRSRLAPPIAARKAAHAAASARLCSRLFAERPKAFHRRIEALWEGATPTPEDDA